MLAKAIIALILSTVVLTGCCGVANKAADQIGGQASGGNDTINIPGGGQTTGGGQLPSELQNFPAPSGFKAQSGASTSQGGDTISIGSWVGSGTVQSAVDFYKSNMVSQGWKLEASYDQAGVASVLSFSKGDRIAAVTVSKTGNDVSVTVTIGKNTGSR